MFRRRSSFLAVGFWLVLMSVNSFAQGKSGGVPCRPLAPEDTSGTPPEVRAVPYCSPIGAVNCEVALAYLYQLASRVNEAKDPYVVVVARLGRGEKSERISWVRLNSAKGFLKERSPGTTVVAAAGERVRGLGQLEFYVGGRLLYVLPYRRDANVDCGVVG
jgi:hypothetical protein